MRSLKQLLEETRAGLSVDIDDVYAYHQSSDEPVLCVALRAAYEAGAALKTMQAGEYVVRFAVSLQKLDQGFCVRASANARVVDWSVEGAEIILVFVTDGGELEPREFKGVGHGTPVPCECRYLGLVGGYVLVEVAQ